MIYNVFDKYEGDYMTNVTVSEIRNPLIFEKKEILTIVNNKKHKVLGYFVPKCYEKEFEIFLNELEKKKKRELLKKIAKAQKADKIEDVFDDIE